MVTRVDPGHARAGKALSSVFITAWMLSLHSAVEGHGETVGQNHRGRIGCQRQPP